MHSHLRPPLIGSAALPRPPRLNGMQLDGVAADSELGGAGDLDRFLPESDFVVICCQWTPETTRLFDKDRFAAMRGGRAHQRRPG
jgi:hypothetical protein